MSGRAKHPDPRLNGNGAAHGEPAAAELSLSKLLAGAELVVFGASGFLGKVFWLLLLAQFPALGRLYLVLRPRHGRSARERFAAEIVTSPALKPLRDAYGEHLAALLADKIVVLDGDIVEPLCGLSAETRGELRGRIAAVVNASGVVDFDPPLDVALEVNAFGVQNLAELARDLGCALLHTSTCFVAGSRTGVIEERPPTEHPFPRASELEQAHWDPKREIRECLDVIEQARERAFDAFRQSHFLATAKANLEARYEPTTGRVLEEEIERVRRKFVEGELADMGRERASFWGWCNTYTYTKSLGEQIAATSGVPFTIVRPAIIESSVAFPFAGWNEGVNTSAPLIYAIREGQPTLPGSDHKLDLIPVDMVACGMALALGELVAGTAPAVYQLGSSDRNPVTMARVFELVGLYKRAYYQRTGRGGPLLSKLQAHFEGAIQSSQAFERFGPSAYAKGASVASSLLARAAVGRAEPLLAPAARALDKFASKQQKLARVLGQFAPFTADYDYTFDCSNVRAAHVRLAPADRRKVSWEPESIDWRNYVLGVHVPALEKWVFPEIERRIRRAPPPPKSHPTLVAMLEEAVRRYDLAVALQRTEPDGLSRITYRDCAERARACALRLKALGVMPRDRVMLSARNDPDWVIALFGILYLGATVVPVDADAEATAFENLGRASRAKVLIAGGGALERSRSVPELVPQLLELARATRAMSPGEANGGYEQLLIQSRAIEPTDQAALLYTSGTTGKPKGVMLSHRNLASLVASLGPLFPLSSGDRVLSVLPLHHAFELTCGLLLPLSRGARVVYLDELTAERLGEALQAGRITAMTGVPALWQMVERRIRQRVARYGTKATRTFDFAVEVNRVLSSTTGLDAGKLLFGNVHEALGGHLKYVVSGGAALPLSTQRLFTGIGLPLAEGYGLTEAAPVLSVASARPGQGGGHVGKPIPGVELRLSSPDRNGVGEILARGPNVMLGYSDDEAATRAVFDGEGWLSTGDLGKFDRSGNLVIVGRSKDVIISTTGENVYPDDIEQRVGCPEPVVELAIVGVASAQRGEQIGCVAVVAPEPLATYGERRERGRSALEKRFAELPPAMRPAFLYVTDSPLPRTASRKVSRRQVQALLGRLRAAEVGNGVALEPGGDARLIAAIAATIARRSQQEIGPGTSLRGELGFDSLMLLELLVALEAEFGVTISAEQFASCERIGDVAGLLRNRELAVSRVDAPPADESSERAPELPAVFRQAAMHWLAHAQSGFYARVMRTKVSGRSHIPSNRQTLVIANHASHLDMGLVKYALGPYGRELATLAAQDYFFESDRLRKAYFENLTNLVPLSRHGSIRLALREAGALLEAGRIVLVFPEATRSPNGELQRFRSLSARLALAHGVDLLPIWLGGTFQALPKGAKVLRARSLEARIGKPLELGTFRRLAAPLGLSTADNTRLLTRLMERAVAELGAGRSFDLDQLTEADLGAFTAVVIEQPSLSTVFSELERRFVKGTVKDPISYYFSLGDREKWTLWVDPVSCRVSPGKAVDVADCVLKTSPDMFTRIVRDRYLPSAHEFLSGAVKSNNIPLLHTFQRVFQLSDSSALTPSS